MRPPRFLVPRSCWSITVAAALTGAVLNAAAASLQQDLPSAPDSGVERVGIVSWPANSRLDLPHPFPNITAAHLLNGRERVPLKWSCDSERTKLQVELPPTPPARMPATIVLERTLETKQFADGRIVFSAMDAKLSGGLKRASQPGDHYITAWTNIAAEVSWDYRPTRWGSYDLEVAFAADGGAGTELQFEIAGQTLTASRPSTDSWSRYATLPVGRFYLAKSDPFTLRARCTVLKGAAAMNLRAVTLRPAPEGKPIAQEPSGAIPLIAHDATTHSVQMRYEPARLKNCLGYWTNPQDWADWEFKVSQPGTFEIEVWQGCGQGQGGSEVTVEVADQEFTFVVEEAGHFQIFLPRRLGRVLLPSAGDYTLAIKPQRKQAAAVMDIQQIRLLPVSASAPAKKWELPPGGGPVDAEQRPLIRKLGTIDLDLVETTPIAFNGRLYRFEWVREGYWNNRRKTNYFRFVDHDTGEAMPPFADGHEFGSAFVHGETVCVTGTLGRGAVNVFSSRDLKSWESWPALPSGRYGIFNTSLCRAGDEFVLMFEIDRPTEEAGVPFTARFAKSRDLHSWTITSPECNYAKDRYTAPHCLRWRDGWFYDFYLEAHDGYELRVVRSRDLINWQASPLNPVLRASPEDKRIANPKLNNDQRAHIAHAVNLNNSDIDFCEWQGRLIINYSWGNQQGIEHLAEAIYDGTESQFLGGWFPDTPSGQRN